MGVEVYSWMPTSSYGPYWGGECGRFALLFDFPIWTEDQEATSTWTTDRVECICVHLELVASRLLYPPPTLESSGPAWRSLRCHLIAIGTCFSNRAHRVNLGRRGFVGRKLHRLRSASLFYRRHGLGPSIDTILTGTRSRRCLILIGSLLYHFRLYRITTQ
jgi:hypothetical protein